jgi:hypothetical protein
VRHVPKYYLKEMARTRSITSPFVHTFSAVIVPILSDPMPMPTSMAGWLAEFRDLLSEHLVPGYLADAIHLTDIDIVYRSEQHRSEFHIKGSISEKDAVVAGEQFATDLAIVLKKTKTKKKKFELVRKNAPWKF